MRRDTILTAEGYESLFMPGMLATPLTAPDRTPPGLSSRQSRLLVLEPWLDIITQPNIPMVEVLDLNTRTIWEMREDELVLRYYSVWVAEDGTYPIMVRRITPHTIYTHEYKWGYHSPDLMQGVYSARHLEHFYKHVQIRLSTLEQLRWQRWLPDKRSVWLTNEIRELLELAFATTSLVDDVLLIQEVLTNYDNT